MDERKRSYTCVVCGRTFSRGEVIPNEAVREEVAREIARDYPNWTAEGFICKSDLTKYQVRYFHSLIESEKGEITALEKEVLRSIQEHEVLAKNIQAEFEQNRSFGQKLADRIAAFGGSWTFLICFGAFIALWIGMNSIVLIWHPPDPYPFILLNLILSCLAAIQAPIIMMSQKRQEEKDRLRSQHDYQINLKAELEIRHLHEKIDHLLSHQWDRLAQIQQIQLDMLSEIINSKK